MVEKHVVPNVCSNPNPSRETVLIKFENKVSRVWDEIPITVIKYSYKQLLTPLLHVKKSSLSIGIFPEKLKISKVIPIFKTGNPEEITIDLYLYYPHLLKYMRVMSLQLRKYPEDNNILDIEKFGFRRERSDVSVGINFIESVINSIDKKELCVGIFINITKAFNSVSHSELNW